MRTEGHDMGKDTIGNTPSAAEVQKLEPEHHGYETSDVHVKGIAGFLAGLFGMVVVFFFFCYGMGKVINNLWVKQDGAPTKWTVAAGTVPVGKGANLENSPEMEQRQLQLMVANFPQPRLDIDDGNQATADLHAREDLLLDNYSKVDGRPDTVRIPIGRAMELIAQRGLPVATKSTNATISVAYASRPEIKTPLTTGFARTGFELTTIEARQQKMNYNREEVAAEK